MPTLPRLAPRTRLVALAALLALALGTAPSAAAGAAADGAGLQAPVVCPATFQVLHDDHVGRLQLQAGPYEVTVYGGLSCARSTDLFAHFLEDWDGDLPRPWRLDVAAARFSRGGGPLGFSVRRVDQPHGGGGRHPAHGRLCPGTFRVLHDDRIGALRLPAGRYTITLLSLQSMSCQKAARLFSGFLDDYDGVLPGRWALDPETGTFRRGASRVGFRVKPASGGGGGGGGVHPRRGERCPGTFRVLHDDRIGRLRLPRGRYWITLLSSRGLTCSQASARLTQFLDEDFDGILPRPWVLNVGRGEFRRGRGSNVGFRVKPVRQI